MRRREIVAAVVLVCVAIGHGVLTSQLPDRTLPNTPGPAFFPWINTVALLVLSGMLLWQGLTGARDGETSPAAPVARRSIALALSAFTGYLVALWLLGFALATIPFFVALMLVWGERRPMWLATGGVGVPLLLFVVFRHGFNVFLPRGLLAGVLG